VHGSSFSGDGARALNDLATAYETRFNILSCTSPEEAELSVCSRERLEGAVSSRSLPGLIIDRVAVSGAESA
jgi:hypothetical protein